MEHRNTSVTNNKDEKINQQRYTTTTEKNQFSSSFSTGEEEELTTNLRKNNITMTSDSFRTQTGNTNNTTNTTNNNDNTFKLTQPEEKGLDEQENTFQTHQKSSNDNDDNHRSKSHRSTYKNKESRDSQLIESLFDKSQKKEQNLLRNVDDPDFSSVTTFRRSANRKSEKEETRGVLRKVESRNRKIKELSGSTSNQQNQASSEMTQKTSKTRWFLDESKNKARQNYLEHIKSNRIEDVKMESQKEKEQLVAQYKHQIDKLMDEKSKLQFEAESSQKKVTECREESKSLRYTIELLQQKLEKMTEREIENQKKLRVFSNMEPLFDKISEQFNFQHPREVLERLENLEKEQAENYSKLLEAQEMKNDYERKLERVEKENETKRRQELTDLQHSLTKTEKQRRDLQKQLEDAQMESKRLEEFQQKYLTLDAAVLDLWYRWVKEIEDMDEKTHVEETVTSIEAIGQMDNLLTQFTPTKAGEGFRVLSGLSNRFWRKWFKDIPSIKSKPDEIFLRVGQLVEAREKDMELLRQQVETLERDKKMYKGELERANINLRAKEAFIKKKEDSSKKRFAAKLAKANRPSSAPSSKKRKKTKPPTRPHTSRIPTTNNNENGTNDVKTPNVNKNQE
eukprot:gb/GECH01002058.1/.p1 GENE.gb/GECH01002058.1/~~gb/GECH01002058.1/.p1  ORF type:complete len:625 (+),score=200.81 gb/GECH01002058.1/:1-1875(+)